MMPKFLTLLPLILQILATHSLIIPDEIPSLLSVVYSNIPTIKKGTDSRYGWGFRFGNRADFQVLVELGPQLNTQPIRTVGGSSFKRNTNTNLQNTLYAQQQLRKKQAPSTTTTTTEGKWLDQWKETMRQTTEYPNFKLGIGEIDAKSVIPDDSIMTLLEMYKKREKDIEKVKAGLMSSMRRKNSIR